MEEPRPIESRRIALRILPNGVTEDFINEVHPIFTYFDMGGIERVKQFIRERNIRIKHYEERYHEYIEEDLVNEKNRAKVAEINAIVDLINQDIDDLDHINSEEFMAKCEKLITIIRGPHEAIYPDYS